MTTAQAVSRALTKAGFTKSTSYPSAIRGLRNRTRGFAATKWDENGAVRVDHYTGMFRGGDVAEPLMAYGDALGAAGFDVESSTGGLVGGYLIVRTA